MAADVVRGVLQVLRALCVVATLLAGIDWQLRPATLPPPDGAPIIVEAVVGRHQRREVVSFEAEGRSRNVPCAMVPALCAELKQRPMPQLTLWWAEPGWLAGDWILQAREAGPEGVREWVKAAEQRQRFATMAAFYDKAGVIGAAGVVLITGLITGLLRGWRRAQ